MSSIRAQPSLESPKHCISRWDRVDSCFRFWVNSTSGLYMIVFTEVVQCRYRWTVEVDCASPKTLPQPLWSRWYRFPSPNYNYFWYPSTVLNFSVKEASGEIGIWISEKPAPKNVGIAFEIASISVSVAKLLVLPVWCIISTSVL